MTPPETSDQGNMVSQRQGEWVLVPREPTQAMINNAHDSYGDFCAAQGIWAAMLSAAPPPEPRADDGVVERHMLSEPDSENPSIEGLIERLREPWERIDGASVSKINRILKERKEAANTISRLKGERDEAHDSRKGMAKAWRQSSEAQGVEIQRLEDRSLQLEAEIKELRSGLEVSEEFIADCLGDPDWGDEPEDAAVLKKVRSLLTKGEVEDGFGSARASRDAAVSPGRPDSPHSDEGGEA